MACYAKLVVTWWSTTSDSHLREHFLLSGLFYLHSFLLFHGFAGAGSLTSKLARFYADLRNIAPARLFVWITAIHNCFICGSFYLRSIDLIWNISFLPDLNSLRNSWASLLSLTLQRSFIVVIEYCILKILCCNIVILMNIS